MQQKDIEILKSLYNGNHLSEIEKQRAEQLIKLLSIDLKNRV